MPIQIFECMIAYAILPLQQLAYFQLLKVQAHSIICLMLLLRIVGLSNNRKVFLTSLDCKLEPTKFYQVVKIP